CAPLFGMWVDRAHGKKLLAGCCVLGGAALLAIPLAESLAMFYLLSALVGIASAMGQYETCFSYLVRRYPQRSGYPIILVTLMAGFASSLAFPFFYHIGGTLGWQSGVVILGVLCVSMGASFYLTSEKSSEPGSAQSRHVRNLTAGPRPLRLQLLLLLVLVTLSRALAMMAIKTVHTQILPLMQSIGASSAFMLVLASSIGPMQVFGRLLLLFWARLRRVPPLRFGAGTHIALVAGALSLLIAFPVPAAAVPFVVLHGMAIGLFSVLSPLVTARLFGVERIGQYVGISALFAKAAAATAPIVSSALLSFGGLHAVPIALLLLSSAALFSFLLAILWHVRISARTG
ncbi:MAG: MFS transporter, partial [Spirochaeta sp.]